jgi:hypothetical protein
VDDKEVANKKVPHTIPALMTIDETFDVGVDTRTSVDDKDYQVPFRFTGKLNKLTFKLGHAIDERRSSGHSHALAKGKDCGLRTRNCRHCLREMPASTLIRLLMDWSPYPLLHLADMQ